MDTDLSTRVHSAPIVRELSAWLFQYEGKTRRTYAQILKDFSTHITGEEFPAPAFLEQRLSQVDVYVAQQYLLSLESRKGQKPRVTTEPSTTALMTFPFEVVKDGTQHTLTYSTINKYHACLRSAFKHLQALGLIRINPFAAVRQKRSSDAGMKRETKPITFKELRKMIGAIDAPGHIGAQDRMLVELLFITGIRRASFCALQLRDISPDCKVISIRKGKGGSPYRLPVARDTAKRLKQHVKWRNTIPGTKETSPLFVQFARDRRRTPRANNQISESSLYNKIKLYSEQVGLKYITPHSGRATVATELSNNKIPLMEIKKITGHKSIAMVEHYVKANQNYSEHPVHAIELFNGQEDKLYE
jgi:integrase